MSLLVASHLRLVQSLRCPRRRGNVRDKTMTREQAKEAAMVMLAYANGEQVQVQLSDGSWIDFPINPDFDWQHVNYRIKPKPESKYRPFKSQEECRNEMHKHSDFGWIKGNVTGEYRQVIRVFSCKTELIFNLSYNSPMDYSPEMMFSGYTFTDGEPFGIKEE